MVSGILSKMADAGLPVMHDDNSVAADYSQASSRRELALIPV